MRFENQAYLLKQMEEKDSRKNEAGQGSLHVQTISGNFRHKIIFSLPFFLERQLHVTSKIMDQNFKKILKCHCLFSEHEPLVPPDFLQEKIQHHREVGLLLFCQEKYLQQIQAAILERDAEAPRVDSIRVTGKMARA